jgi:hypothetical protein
MKKSFYLKYLEQQEMTNKKKVKLDGKRPSNFFTFLSNSTHKFARALFYLLLTILVSIGATVLINPSIREIFLKLLGGN